MATAAAPTPNPLKSPMTWAQIQAEANKEIDAQIAGQNAPLIARTKTLGGQETSARAAIGQEFQSLLPGVQSSAGRVASAYGGALSAEQSIFSAAQTRMNQLHQQQAQEAQQLAQQMGGPVTTGQFTQNMAPYETALGSEGPAAMLDTLGRAQTGVQSAEAFAGQVFPAMQTEQQAQSDNFYKNQIKDLQNQIDQNAGTKSTLVGAKQAELLAAERQFKLNLAKQAMDKKTSQHQWAVERQQIASSKLSGKLAKGAAARQGIAVHQAGIRLNQEQQRLDYMIKHGATQDQLARQRLAISAASAQARIAHENATAKAGAARVSDSIQKDAISVIQAAMGSGKPVSMTHRAYVPGKALPGLKPPAGSYYDPQKKQYYRVVHETMTPQEWRQMTGEGGAGTHPITDPNRLFDYMRGTLPQLGRKATIRLIRAQTHHPNWSPGQKTSFTGNDLHTLPTAELKGLARRNGYTGPLGKKYSRQAIVDYLMHITSTVDPQLAHNHP